MWMLVNNLPVYRACEPVDMSQQFNVLTLTLNVLKVYDKSW